MEFTIYKITGSIGYVIDGCNVYTAYDLDGRKVGYNTIRASADVVGGWAGASIGLRYGAIIGGGIANIPGAIIGGAVGSIMGSFGGSYISINAIDYLYGR